MPTVWRLMAHHEHPTAVADRARTEGRLWIGWGEIGDVSQNPYHSARDIAQAIRHHYPQLNNAHLGGPSVWRFFHDMQLADLVVVSTRKGPALTMEVTGPYEWERTNDEPPLTGNYFHHRAAQITDLDPNILFRQAGGIAVGENRRWTLFRCANPVTTQE